MEKKKFILIVILNGVLNWRKDVKLRRIIWRNINTLLSKDPLESPIDFQEINILYTRRYIGYKEMIYSELGSNFLSEEIEKSVAEDIATVFGKKVMIMMDDH